MGFTSLSRRAYLFPSILLNCPYVHNLVFICYSSLFAGMNAVASYLLSLLGFKKIVGVGAAHCLLVDL